MTLIFGVDPGIIEIHSHAKFHEAKIIGLDFRGLNAFRVRALEKEKRNKPGETLKKAVLKALT